ncbi:MAG: DMT family transporter [Halofilum sp. (in: g-proteobacteria)]|nr:DMT family transporter [Halofilum sp. (in: g-proteobacteria)]
MSTPPNTGAGRRSEVEIGMGLMALTMLAAPGMDAIAKLLGETLAPGQIAWGRFGFQTLLLLPFMLATGRRVRTGQAAVHAARGALLGTALLLLIWALQYLPLANALAIFFVEPLILTLFSALFLGERIGGRRLAAVVVGLAGALVVIRPNWAAFGWGAVLPLGTAICFAGYLTLTRHAVASEDPLALQLWAGLFAALLLTAAVLAGAGLALPVLDPVWPDGREWSLLVTLGLFSAVTHVLIATAFRLAPAGILAPFQYIEIVSATALGVLLFGDFPDAITWAGTALIIGSGLYVYARERKLARGLRSVPQAE